MSDDEFDYDAYAAEAEASEAAAAPTDDSDMQENLDLPSPKRTVLCLARSAPFRLTFSSIVSLCCFRRYHTSGMFQIVHLVFLNVKCFHRFGFCTRRCRLVRAQKQTFVAS